MIRIIKKGVVLRKPTKIIYRATCKYCGCVFNFENEDIKSQERRLNGNTTIECPCCHKDLIGKFSIEVKYDESK